MAFLRAKYHCVTVPLGLTARRRLGSSDCSGHANPPPGPGGVPWRRWTASRRLRCIAGESTAALAEGSDWPGTVRSGPQIHRGIVRQVIGASYRSIGQL
jgi:hypothetical protein